MEPLVQCHVIQVSMRVSRGSVSWLSSHGRGHEESSRSSVELGNPPLMARRRSSSVCRRGAPLYAAAELLCIPPLPRTVLTLSEPETTYLVSIRSLRGLICLQVV